MKFSDSMFLADMSCGGKSLGSKAAIASAIRGSAKPKANHLDSGIVVKSGRLVGLDDTYEALYKNGEYIGCRRKHE